MAFTIECVCGAKYRVEEQHAGKAVKCPRCGAGITVPTAAPGSHPAAPVAPPPVPAAPAPSAAEPMVPIAMASRPQPAAGPPVGVSKGLYLWLWLVGTTIAWLCLSVTENVLREADIDKDALGLFKLAAFAGGLLAGIPRLVLFYKMWATLGRFGRVRTTPGKAVGFCFIPFFNLYWIFQVIWGWAKDFNRTRRQLGLRGWGMLEGVALAGCVLELAMVADILSVAPLLRLLASVLGALFIAGACDGINSLSGLARAEADDEAEGGPSSLGRGLAGGVLALVGYMMLWPFRLFWLHDTMEEFLDRFDLDDLEDIFEHPERGPAQHLFMMVVGTVFLVFAVLFSIRAMTGQRRTLSPARRQWSLAGLVLAGMAVAELLWVILLIACQDDASSRSPW